MDQVKAYKFFDSLRRRLVKTCNIPLKVFNTVKDGIGIKASPTTPPQYREIVECAQAVIQELSLPVLLDKSQKSNLLLFIRLSETPEAEEFIESYTKLGVAKTKVAKKVTPAKKKAVKKVAKRKPGPKKKAPAKKKVAPKKAIVKKSTETKKRAYKRKAPLLNQNVRAVGMHFETLSDEDKETFIRKHIKTTNSQSLVKKLTELMHKEGCVLVSKQNPLIQKGKRFVLNVIDIKNL